MGKKENIKQKKPTTLKNTFNKYDPKLASVFLPWACRHPKYLKSFFKLKRANTQAKEYRQNELKDGIKVPPFLILSITSKCNLQCSGCFAAAAGTTCYGSTSSKNIKTTLDLDQWRKIIKEAGMLGVFGFVIAGGEPFLFPGLISLFKEFKNRFFLVLTNGTTIGEDDHKTLKKFGNIAVLVSIEGRSELTDERRGKGVYEKSMSTLKKLGKNGVLSGISVTITSKNYTYWMKPENIDYFISQGIHIGVFIEYIPLTPLYDTDSKDSDYDLLLNKKEREEFRSQILNYRETKPIYVVHSPGDEEFFGGCVSAGRGFAHITPTGDLTPCPISNIATHNLTVSTLREGLASPLFKEIRENEHLLETDGMPCALFAHPKEVDELAKSVGAYKTDIESGFE